MLISPLYKFSVDLLSQIEFKLVFEVEKVAFKKSDSLYGVFNIEALKLCWNKHHLI